MKFNPKIALYALLASIFLIYVGIYFKWVPEWFEATYFTPTLLNIISSAIVVFIGIPFLQDLYFNWIQRQNRENLLTFWDLNFDNPVSVLYGSQEVGLSDDSDPSRALSVFTAMSYNTLQSLINTELKFHTDLVFHDSRGKSTEFWSERLTGNTIIIGGDISFPFLVALLKEVGAHYYQDCLTDENARKIKGISEFLSEVSADGVPTKDHCLVTRIKPHDSGRNGAIVFVSGNYGIGTFAAVEYFSATNRLKFSKNDVEDISQFIVSVEEIHNGIDFNRANLIMQKVFGAEMSAAKWNEIVSKLIRENPNAFTNENYLVEYSNRNAHTR